MTPQQQARLYAEVQRQKAAAQALTVAPLTADEVVAAAKARGDTAADKIVSTLTVRSSMLPPDTGRVGIYHAYAVTDSGASFVRMKDPHDYPVPAIFIWFDSAKANTNYLLDCRFSSPDGPDPHGPDIQMSYKVYDDDHEIHPVSQETSQKGHITGLFDVGTAGGVTVHLSFADTNVKSIYFQGCEIYELGQ